MNGYFGVRWNAPAFQEAPELPCPVGQMCLLCQEVVVEGESGVIMAFVDAQSQLGIAPQHIECFLRSVMGSVHHLERRCICYGGAATHVIANYRAEARESMEWLVLHGH